jgi:hypothetical protein
LIIQPLINPIVNPADILPVSGISKLVIANEEAVAAASDNNNNDQRIIMTTILAGVISGIAIATIIVIKRK